MNQDPQSNDDVQESPAEASAASAAAASGDGSSAASAAASSSSSGAGFDVESEALLNEIEQLKAEAAEAKDMAVRAQAEAQNTRRRAEMDVEKAHKYALEKFVSDMLPVADNLERALGAAGEQSEDTAAFVEGVELTLKSLLDALKRHGVEQVNPVNEPFDPQLHQAMTAVPNAEVEPNTILDVFQRGYTLNGRLVRPAMVVVSKAG